MSGAAPDVSTLYQQAAARWPAVRWSEEAFARHLAADPTGARPNHPLDLYLAGAAGQRIDSAWLAIETELGPAVRKVLQRQPSADWTADDLWSEARARLMDADPAAPPLPQGVKPARIIRYRGLVRLLNYLTVVAKRIAIERDRQLKRRPASVQESAEAAPEIADPDAPAPDTRLHEAEAADLLARS